MKIRNPFRRSRIVAGENPFRNKTSLGKFLGQLAAGVIEGRISEREAEVSQKLVTDFLRLLAVQDFAFELDAVTSPRPDRKELSYAT
jgi:hypothetical protein